MTLISASANTAYVSAVDWCYPGWRPFPSILGKLRSSEEWREEEAGLRRRRRSGWVPVSLNGSHWIWREKLTAWLLILLLRQRLAVGQLENESLRLIQTFSLLAKAFKQFSVRYAPDKARAPACLHTLRISNSFWVEITLEKMTSKLSFFVTLVLNLLYYYIFLTAGMGNSLCNVILGCGIFASYITTRFKAPAFHTRPDREPRDSKCFTAGWVSQYQQD